MKSIERDPGIHIHSEIGAMWRAIQLLHYATQDLEVFDEKYEWLKKQRMDRRVIQKVDGTGQNPVAAIEDMYAVIEDLERRLTGNGRTSIKTSAMARIGELEQQNRQLREEAKQYEEFVIGCTELIPEGFDDDAAAEAVILNYLKELSDFAGIIARLTSAYR
jgi:hypothetical protein